MFDRLKAFMSQKKITTHECPFSGTMVSPPVKPFIPSWRIGLGAQYKIWSYSQEDNKESEQNTDRRIPHIGIAAQYKF